MTDPPTLEFVRLAPGSMIPRYGTQEFLGATRSLVRETSGKLRATWEVDCSRVLRLGDEYRARYRRELQRHVDAGELVLCTRSDWMAQQPSDLETPSNAEQQPQPKPERPKPNDHHSRHSGARTERRK